VSHAARVRLGLALRENFGRISFRRSIGQGGIRVISALDESFRLRGVCLENRYTRKGIVGSNPTLSAVPSSLGFSFFRYLPRIDPRRLRFLTVPVTV
jgi:hypothetical protein